MSQQENPNKQPKKIGPVTLTKNNLVKIAGATAIAVCGVVGVNSYFSYQHQIFLENYTNAIASIDNGQQAGYKDAFTVLKDLADSDKASPSDLYYLGYMYQYGLDISKDYSDAYKYYKKSAASDNAMAYYQLATLYENGNGVNKDQIKALDYYKKSYQLWYLPAVNAIAKMLEANARLVASAGPKMLYEIYLAYDQDQIKEADSSIKEKYLLASAAEGYEPALIVQAHNFTKAGDNYRSLMLWQTLLYSSDPKVSKIAKTEIPKIQKLVEVERKKEESELENEQVVEIKKQKALLVKQVERQKEIEYKKAAGRTIPMQKNNNLNGLIYINIFNIGTDSLQDFYKDITGIEIETNLINNIDNLHTSYIDNFMKVANLKHSYSSLLIDFGDYTSTNKFEGLVYYYYNSQDKYTNYIVSNIIQNKPKKSSLLPTLLANESPSYKKAKEEVEENKDDIDTVKLTYEEEIQRMQVFAQKGDYKQFYNLEKIAEKNDVYAMYYLGKYYYNEKEYDNALKYFRKAADANYGPAYYKLASLYYNEEHNDVPYNKQKAIEYYKKAADLNVRNAKHILMLIE
jgi:TPR repeat protein